MIALYITMCVESLVADMCCSTVELEVVLVRHATDVRKPPTSEGYLFPATIRSFATLPVPLSYRGVPWKERGMLSIYIIVLCYVVQHNSSSS